MIFNFVNADTQVLIKQYPYYLLFDATIGHISVISCLISTHDKLKLYLETISIREFRFSLVISVSS